MTSKMVRVRKTPRVIAAALLVMTSGVAIVGFADRAFAANPVIKGPDRVYSEVPPLPAPQQGVSIAFSGTELLDNVPVPEKKKISITADQTVAQCVLNPTPPATKDETGCVAVTLTIPGAAGLLSFNPANVDVTSGSAAGGAAIQFTGLLTDVNTALATLMFAPASGYTNLRDTPARLQIDVLDGAIPTRVNTTDTGGTWFVDIRVAPLDIFATEAVPPTQHVDVNATDTMNSAPNLFTVSDPDINSNGVPGNMLLIKWLDPSCGTFTASGSGAMTWGTNLVDVMAGALNYADSTVSHTAAQAIYDTIIPNSVKSLPLSTDPTVPGTAFAGVGDLTAVNNTLSTVTYTAPAIGGQTCTMHDLTFDLGNHGLPGQYIGTAHAYNQYAVGYELPGTFPIPFLINNVGFVITAPPTIAKAFATPSIMANTSTALTFTLTNPNSATALSGIGFTDPFPAGLVVATPNGLTTTCTGAVTAAAGTTTVTLTGASLAAAGNCTVTANVTATTTGTKNNTTGAVTSTEGGTGLTASASLAVTPPPATLPPTIAGVFGAASIPVNTTTALTFTLTNPNSATALSGIGFTDPFPAGLVVATPNGLTTTCTGAVTAAAGTTTVTLTGASLAAAGNCTVTVNVTGNSVGQIDDTTSNVTSAEGGAGNTAFASMLVTTGSTTTTTTSTSTTSTTTSTTTRTDNTSTSIVSTTTTGTLPTTGSESGVIVIMGSAMIAAGLLLLRSSRRSRTQ